MPHNPILSQKKIGRLDRVEIAPGQQGVLLIKNQVKRLLNPGEGVSVLERAEGGLVLYTIDCAPHEASWRVDLPTSDLKDWFPTTINMIYQVRDSQRMVEDKVVDTEALIARVLESLLRERSRQYSLDEHENAEKALQEILITSHFAECGLHLHKADIVMNFNQDHLDRIEQLAKWARAMRVPQQAEYNAELPTKEGVYKFQIKGILNFKVISQNNLPTDTLEEAEAWLWRQVRAKLRSIGRQYTVNQFIEAEAALQEALEEEVFSNHGLEIVSAHIEIELDEQARKHAEELEGLRTQKSLENEQAELEKLREQRRHLEELEALRRKHEAELETMRVQKALEEEQAKLEELRQQRKHAEEMELLRRKYTTELETVTQKKDLVEAQAGLDKIQQEIKRAEELSKLGTQLTLEVKRGELEELLHQRNLDQKKKAIDFYGGYIEKGQWQLLAMALANNEMDASRVIGFLDAQQREKLKLQVEILKSMIKEDALPEYISEKFTIGFLDDLASKIKSEGPFPALKAAEELKVLTDSKEQQSKEEQVLVNDQSKTELEGQESEGGSAPPEKARDEAELASPQDQGETERIETPEDNKKGDEDEKGDEEVPKI